MANGIAVAHIFQYLVDIGPQKSAATARHPSPGTK